MSDVVVGDISGELGRRICEAWGIDPAVCLCVDIAWRPGQMPFAVVELALTEGVVRELLTLAPTGDRRRLGLLDAVDEVDP